MKISLIAGMGKNREIGMKNNLIWRVKSDLRNFKKLTWGHHILMGRKTFESIGRPLPGRTGIVLSRGENHFDPSLHASCIDEAFLIARRRGETELFVIGGSEIYKATLPYADKLYLSFFNDEQPADCFFPDFQREGSFRVVDEQSHAGEGDGPSWRFQVLERIG